MNAGTKDMKTTTQLNKETNMQTIRQLNHLKETQSITIKGVRCQSVPIGNVIPLNANSMR